MAIMIVETSALSSSLLNSDPYQNNDKFIICNEKEYMKYESLILAKLGLMNEVVPTNFKIVIPNIDVCLPQNSPTKSIIHTQVSKSKESMAFPSPPAKSPAKSTPLSCPPVYKPPNISQSIYKEKKTVNEMNSFLNLDIDQEMDSLLFAPQKRVFEMSSPTKIQLTSNQKTKSPNPQEKKRVERQPTAQSSSYSTQQLNSEIDKELFDLFTNSQETSYSQKNKMMSARVEAPPNHKPLTQSSTAPTLRIPTQSELRLNSPRKSTTLTVPLTNSQQKPITQQNSVCQSHPALSITSNDPTPHISQYSALQKQQKSSPERVQTQRFIPSSQKIENQTLQSQQKTKSVLLSNELSLDDIEENLVF